ncbi:MAG: response regulator, partial [Candidatus Aegiribacteria sp.]|nr:response regulator [Candidatus Aegiribacteria sp.]MBD3295293.1 response regulator [Candidatus Fermentibacteria bacterium]
VQLRMMMNDGWKWMDLYTSVFRRDEDGRLLQIIGALFDIHESKEAGLELKKSHRSLKQAEEIANLGHFERDWQTGEGSWSSGFCRILGIDPASGEYSHDDFMEFVHPQDRERVEKHVRDSIRNHVPMNVDFRLLTPGGRKKHVHGIAVNYYDQDGTPLRTVGVFQDVTERREVEKEKRRLQQQLTQAQKMESVGRLAGGVAHDFNNMLSVILGHSDMVLDSLNQDDPLRASLREIHKAAQRSADLTRQLLAFARRQTVSLETLDLNETIDSMLKMLKRLIGENIQLDWKPADRMAPVRIDPAQIDQIMANLVVNSRDAISGTGFICIETDLVELTESDCSATEMEPGVYAKLTVSDDGRGMDEETRALIFEPFFTTKEVGEGTGLGLATVYGIVKQNNGHINVYSEPERGTTFRIYLPVLEEKDETRAVHTDLHDESESGGETILLAEDEPSILEMATRMLKSLGYRVLFASSPEKAIVHARENSGEIDLLITDVVMPQMNGRELAKRVGRFNPELRCLFISGYTANVIAHHGVLDEDVHFLQKPFTRKELSENVRNCLES